MAIPGNLLTAEQESMETGISSYHPGSNTSIAQSTAHPQEGTHSLEVTVTGTSGDVYFNLGSDSVAGVQTATTFYYWAYTDASGITAQVELDYENSSSAYVDYDSFNKQSRPSTPLTAGASTQVLMDTPSAAADATTDRFYGYLYLFGAAVGDKVYVDKVFYGTPQTTETHSGTGAPLTVAMSLGSGTGTAQIPEKHSGSGAALTVTMSLGSGSGVAVIPERHSGQGAPITVSVSLGAGAGGMSGVERQIPSTTQDPLNVSSTFPLRYTLLVYETVTGDLVQDLSDAYDTLSYNTPLDDTGRCSAKIKLTARELNGVNLEPLTRPWKFSLLVAIRGQVQWFGPINPGRPYTGDRTIQLDASELWAIFGARPMWGNLATVGVNGEAPTDMTVTADDLASLAVKVVQYATSMKGGSLPLQLPSVVEGDAHTRTYKGNQTTWASEALKQLSQAEGGPDIRFDGEFADGTPRKARWIMRTG